MGEEYPAVYPQVWSQLVPHGGFLNVLTDRGAAHVADGWLPRVVGLHGCAELQCDTPPVARPGELRVDVRQVDVEFRVASRLCGVRAVEVGWTVRVPCVVRVHKSTEDHRGRRVALRERVSMLAEHDTR